MIGTLGYYFLEDGWSLLDAFYMVIISITTVGYGEIHELSPAGRVFTIFLILSGLGVAATTMTKVAKFLLEGEIKGAFRRKRVSKKISKLKNHYIVCGHGRSGSTICLKLYELNIPFVVIDNREEALQIAEERGFLTVPGNAGSDVTLLAAGIERAKGLVTCCSDDGTNLLIALAARELNPNIYIISLGTFPTNESRMIRAGADEVVYPIRLGSEQVAKFIGKQYGIDLEDSTNLAPPNLLGYNLKLVKYFDSKNAPLKNIIDRYNAISVVALKRKSGITIENPGLDTLVERDDSVILLVKEDKKAITSPTSFEKIVWSDDYSVGIQSIDEEHRGLILLINRFGDALFISKSKKEVAKSFEQLLDYTVNHFRNEEELMEKYNYPEIKQHIQEHHRLTQEVLELNKDKHYVFPDNIIEFLKSWLINHILEVDRRLGEFLVKKGIHER